MVNLQVELDLQKAVKVKTEVEIRGLQALKEGLANDLKDQRLTTQFAREEIAKLKAELSHLRSTKNEALIIKTYKDGSIFISDTAKAYVIGF